MKTVDLKKFFGLMLFLALFAGCGKENILWLEPGHEYDVATILVRNQNGSWDQVYFWDPSGNGNERITFTKFHPLGVSGNGEMKYTYKDANYYASTTETYSFGWSKESQKAITLKFSHYDPIILGHNPNDPSFWESLNGDYVVSKESIAKGQLVAHTIVLRNLTHEIVLVQ